MTDFIFIIGNRNNSKGYKEDLSLIYNYAIFLKKELKLGYFIPCYVRKGIEIPYTNNIDLQNLELFNEYEEAKKMVIFEGIKIIKSKSMYGGVVEYLINKYSNDVIAWKFQENNKFELLYNTIEDLVCCKMKLNNNVFNTIGINF